MGFVAASDAAVVRMLPYGVGQSNEGVSLRLRVGRYDILLDCGVLDLVLHEVPDLVLCSHAHQEQAAGLWQLHQRYPKLPIYASEVTAELLPLNWPEVVRSDFCQALPWRSPLELLPGLTVEMFPAGHLPGAAAFLITYQGEYRVLALGDFSLFNLRSTDGLRLEALRNCQPDLLIVSGCSEPLPHRRLQENQLLDRLQSALDQGVSVLMPMTEIGQAPELLFLLRSHHLLSGRDLDIWVDGALAQSCYLYEALLPHLPSAIQNLAKYQALFWDQRVRPRVQRLPGEGIPTAPSIVLIDGETDCRSLLESGKWLVMKASLELPADEEHYHLSNQADRTAMLQVINSLRPQHLVLIHGKLDNLLDLASMEELGQRYKVHVPMVGQEIEFAVAAEVAAMPMPEITYEGEVAESLQDIVITLPRTLLADARWRSLSDTGIVEATWEGDVLVVRGLPAGELRGDRREAVPEASCYRCQAYRGQYCREVRSPLFNLKVSPEGLCGEFRAV
jgi:Cft2 family RNA processing exonuclease